MTTHTRKDLLALPARKRDDVKTYKSIALVPTSRKHSSGYSWIAIIGFNDHEQPVEIAAYCDDISYSFPEGISALKSAWMTLRTDMFYPSGIAHVWSRHYCFRVGASLSSTTIDLLPKEQG
jgi:hypothetical protein